MLHRGLAVAPVASQRERRFWSLAQKSCLRLDQTYSAMDTNKSEIEYNVKRIVERAHKASTLCSSHTP